MCMITKQKAAKKAKQDIPCYKLFRSNDDGLVLSVFRLYRYTLVYNITNLSMIISDDKLSVHGRFSSILVDGLFNKDEPHTSRSLYKYGYRVISQGFHSILDLNKAYDEYEQREISNRRITEIRKCIIPRGSNYYTDKFGCIVSDEIIIDEKCSYEEVINNPIKL